MYSNVSMAGENPAHHTAPRASSFSEALDAIHSAHEETKAICVQISDAKRLNQPVDVLYAELDTSIAKWEDRCHYAITLTDDIGELREINKMSFRDGKVAKAILEKMAKLLRLS